MLLNNQTRKIKIFAITLKYWYSGKIKKNYSVEKKIEEKKNKKKLWIEIKKNENKRLKTKIENRNKSC